MYTVWYAIVVLFPIWDTMSVFWAHEETEYYNYINAYTDYNSVSYLIQFRSHFFRRLVWTQLQLLLCLVHVLLDSFPVYFNVACVMSNLKVQRRSQITYALNIPVMISPWFYRFTWSRKKPPPTADAASFPTFWNKYPAHLTETQESAVWLHTTPCFDLHRCSHNDWPAAHSSNGQLSHNGVLLSGGSRAVLTKHLVPPALFLDMLCQFHHIKGFCQNTVIFIL